MAEVIDIPKPPNSNLTREHSSLEDGGKALATKKVEHKEAVILEKKSIAQRFKETFVKEDLSDVGDYILWDIIVPSIGRIINDAICGASNRIFLGGGATHSNLYKDGGVTRVVRNDYAGVSRNQQRAAVREVNGGVAAPRTMKDRNNFHLNEWGPISTDLLNTILSQAIDVVDAYNVITVDEFYDIAQQPHEVNGQVQQLEFDFKVPYTAQNWGWRNLNTAEIIPVGAGKSVLKLPKIMYLK